MSNPIVFTLAGLIVSVTVPVAGAVWYIINHPLNKKKILYTSMITTCVVTILLAVVFFANSTFPSFEANLAHHATPAGSITEFPLDTSQDAPTSITAGPDGNLWFAVQSSGKIGRITPNGSLTKFSLPTNSFPGDITTGPDGNLWFTENISDTTGHFINHKIGRITPNGAIAEFSLPTDSFPTEIITGPDNNLWLNDYNSHKISRITPSGSLTEFSLPADNTVTGITTGPDGNLWFTEMKGTDPMTVIGYIGRITPNGSITEFFLSTDNAAIGITTGPDGNLWFTGAKMTNTTTQTRYIGRITPNGSITEFLLLEAHSQSDYIVSNSITVGPDGNLWFTEGLLETSTTQSDKIGRITPSGSITEFSLPANSSPVEITAGPDNNLWFTEYHSGKIGRITSGK
jgi:streptogramin lyase